MEHIFASSKMIIVYWQRTKKLSGNKICVFYIVVKR